VVEIEIDGARFSSVEGFYVELNRHLLPDSSIEAHCLDSLNDVLRDAFGEPSAGYLICWRNSALSREQLGYPETVRQLETRLQHCHPSNASRIRSQIADAQHGVGPTAFDWLLEIIRGHEHVRLELA
jgi:hypothetical protein